MGVESINLPNWVRVRRLADGSRIVEIRKGFWIFSWWVAVDAKDPGFTWNADSRWYVDCLISDDETVLKVLASIGV